MSGNLPPFGTIIGPEDAPGPFPVRQYGDFRLGDLPVGYAFITDGRSYSKLVVEPGVVEEGDMHRNRWTFAQLGYTADSVIHARVVRSRQDATPIRWT